MHTIYDDKHELRRLRKRELLAGIYQQLNCATIGTVPYLFWDSRRDMNILGALDQWVMYSTEHICLFYGLVVWNIFHFPQ